MAGPTTPSSPETLIAYGRRMRAIRARARLSLREAGLRAGVDRNTILRLEQGSPVRAVTRERLCAAYGVFCVDPEAAAPLSAGEGYALHRPEDARWHRARLASAASPSIVDANPEMALRAERMRQGLNGLANQFFAKLECDRPEGRMRAAVLEVFGPSGLARQASGEAFVYALKGALRFTVGEESFVLEEGSAATFDRTLLHGHEPCVPKASLPAILLYVQTD